MKKIVSILVLSSLMMTSTAMAMDSKSHEHMNHDDQAAMDHSKMDHSKMDHGSSQMGGTFKQAMMVDGIHSEFQVMELASMNMKDPEGRTHHIMASFMENDIKIEKIVGKMKLIAPSGKEQIGDLKDFGNGVFATNFTIDEQGKWGVICLFKDTKGKHTAKFWYQHQ